MSNIRNNRLFKTLGATKYIDMLALRHKEIKSRGDGSYSSYSNKFVFYDPSGCSEINNIILENPIKNYYEYKIDLSGSYASGNDIYFPREFYLTGVKIIDNPNYSSTRPTNIQCDYYEGGTTSTTDTIIPNTSISRTNVNTLHVSKIHKIGSSDYVKLTLTGRFSGVSIIFNGFM